MGTTMKKQILALLGVLLLMGCGASQQFAALPADLDTTKVPRQSIDMTAERYQFIPEEVHVKAGTLVTLHIKAKDTTHGFALGAFGIDQRLEKDSVESVTFFAGQKGEYDFHCSHFCGLGHLGMTGKVVVE
jgi:heme/copper-type cytochrome/quinol oxidase subunit 2